MKTKVYFSFYVVIVIVAAIGTATGDGFFSWAVSPKRHKGVAVMQDAQYNEECGACHFPYQGGLLPAASWIKLMKPKALEDHFGENAELDEPVRKSIESILVKNAADHSYYKRSKKIMASLRRVSPPMRITDVPYIKRKHHELSDDEIKKNEKVKSLSYCERCHRKAEKGIYDDDSVVIPGKGKWTW